MVMFICILLAREKKHQCADFKAYNLHISHGQEKT